MSRSKKWTPAGTFCCCKSQKRGKQFSHRRFRRFERMIVLSGEETKFPFRQRDITSPWNLGGDGKCYWGNHPNDEWYQRAMRK